MDPFVDCQKQIQQVYTAPSLPSDRGSRRKYRVVDRDPSDPPPKKPATAYQVYARNFRAKVKQDNPTLSSNPHEISKKLGEMWMAVPADEKAVLSAGYSKKYDVYRQEMKEWKIRKSASTSASSPSNMTPAPPRSETDERNFDSLPPTAAAAAVPDNATQSPLDNLQTLKHWELKELCKSKGLKVTGIKSVLLGRLRESFRNGGASKKSPLRKKTKNPRKKKALRTPAQLGVLATKAPAKKKAAPKKKILSKKQTKKLSNGYMCIEIPPSQGGNNPVTMVNINHGLQDINQLLKNVAAGIDDVLSHMAKIAKTKRKRKMEIANEKSRWAKFIQSNEIEDTAKELRENALRHFQLTEEDNTQPGEGIGAGISPTNPPTVWGEFCRDKDGGGDVIHLTEDEEVYVVVSQFGTNAGMDVIGANRIIKSVDNARVTGNLKNNHDNRVKPTNAINLFDIEIGTGDHVTLMRNEEKLKKANNEQVRLNSKSFSLKFAFSDAFKSKVETAMEFLLANVFPFIKGLIGMDEQAFIESLIIDPVLEQTIKCLPIHKMDPFGMLPKSAYSKEANTAISVLQNSYKLEATEGRHIWKKVKGEEEPKLVIPLEIINTACCTGGATIKLQAGKLCGPGTAESQVTFKGKYYVDIFAGKLYYHPTKNGKFLNCELKELAPYLSFTDAGKIQSLRCKIEMECGEKLSFPVAAVIDSAIQPWMLPHPTKDHLTGNVFWNAFVNIDNCVKVENLARIGSAIQPSLEVSWDTYKYKSLVLMKELLSLT